MSKKKFLGSGLAQSVHNWVLANFGTEFFFSFSSSIFFLLFEFQSFKTSRCRLYIFAGNTASHSIYLSCACGSFLLPGIVIIRIRTRQTVHIWLLRWIFDAEMKCDRLQNFYKSFNSDFLPWKLASCLFFPIFCQFSRFLFPSHV